ncbi:tetraacyldisaccharide 4'-kinase [Pseudomonas putida]|nr:tetraacyldisaccharide 4'-kinase [Pseudomonas putida]
MSLADRLSAAWYTGHRALWLLRPLECLYRHVVLRKRRRFEAGQGEIYRAPVPVLVVGNITVGGTGKTPMILWLIEHCRARGLRVGVVSRGYGAQPPSLPWRVSADQDAAQAGDEPLLIVQRSGVPLVIDPDRGRAVRALLDAEPVDLVLSDDGKPAERLQTVDAVLCNGAADDSPQGYGLALQAQALINVRSGERRPLSHFPPGQALHAVAGIGNPQRFFDTLQALHWQPVAHPFADHARFTLQALSFEPPLPVIMTEKDAEGFSMDTKLLDILACPITKGPLKLSADKTELISKGAGLAYPIRDGIPVMLETEARTLTDDERLDK